MLRPHADLLTIEDLEALPDDGRRHELIGGTIIASPSPVPMHQVVSLNLQDRLRIACPDDHVVFNAPIDLELGPHSMVVPDLVVTPRTSVGDTRLRLPTTLVVEMVSPGSTYLDGATKRAAYADHGIPHYWLVDTRDGDRRFTALRLADGIYETVLDTTGRVSVNEPVPVDFELDDLFVY